MNRYTMELKNAEAIEGVGKRMFSGPLPAFGDELHVDGVGHFRVLRVDHHASSALHEDREGAVFLVRVVVIVEEVK